MELLLLLGKRVRTPEHRVVYCSNNTQESSI